MAVKDYLKSVCTSEQTVYEANLKLEKMYQARDSARYSSESKKKDMENKIAQNKTEITKVEDEIKKYRKVSYPNATGEITISVIVGIIIVLYQIVTYFIVFNATEAMSVSKIASGFAGLYATTALLVFLFLRFFLDLRWGAFWGCAISCGALIWLTNICLDESVSRNISTSGAIIFSFVIVDIIAAIIAIVYCVNGYKTRDEAYSNALSEIRKRRKIVATKEAECKQLQEKIAEHNANTLKALNSMSADIRKQEQYISDLRAKLSRLYAQNVLHQNYQNWVAAATIYEYLDVGRCYELKGVNGAYNLYEKELIAKKILASLSAINDSIHYYGKEISNSQRYIRAQLAECNRKISNITINRYGL